MTDPSMNFRRRWPSHAWSLLFIFSTTLNLAVGTESRGEEARRDHAWQPTLAQLGDCDAMFGGNLLSMFALWVVVPLERWAKAIVRPAFRVCQYFTMFSIVYLFFTTFSNRSRRLVILSKARRNIPII